MILLALLLAAGAARPPSSGARAAACCRRRRARRSRAEVSGARALATVRVLSNNHRMRGSTGYRAAAEAIRDRLRDYGLEGVEIISLPADGTIFYGTQRSRPGWNARSAELWEGHGSGSPPGPSSRSASRRTASPGRAEAELVDIGAGTSEADYQGKEVRGRLVLTSSQPEAVAGPRHRPLRRGGHRLLGAEPAHRLVGRRREPGPLGPSRDLLRPSRPSPSWSRRPARAAGRSGCGAARRCGCAPRSMPGASPSAYLIPTAIIPGRRARPGDRLLLPSRSSQSRARTTMPRAARASWRWRGRCSRLIRSGALPRPERTIRFIWPAEIEATIALLNARPEFARRTLATVHLDMIGGNTRDHQVGAARARLAAQPAELRLRRRLRLRPLGQRPVACSSPTPARRPMPLIEPDGDRRALQAVIGGFEQGSDHEVWAEGSWRVPVIYIADWPDRYIHTQRDLPGNLDPTKMRRAIFIAAASGYYLANSAMTARACSARVRPGMLERARGDAAPRRGAARRRRCRRRDRRARGATSASPKARLIRSYERFGHDRARAKAGCSTR